MIQYFKGILTTFSIAQRIWALIILCVSVFLITFGSNIIEAIKPDPTQQILVVKRQRNQITSLNTQLDNLTNRVDELTQEVIDGQSECSHKRIVREKEIISQIDEMENMLRGSLKQKEKMMKQDQGRGSSPNHKKDTFNRKEIKVIDNDNTEALISALCNMKNKIKNKQ